MFSDKNEFLRDVSGVSIDLGLLPFPPPVVDCVLCEDMTNRGRFTAIFEANKTVLYVPLKTLFCITSPGFDWRVSIRLLIAVC